MLALLFPPSLGHIAASARAELLGKWLSRHFGVEVSIDVAASYKELRSAIENREVDLAWAPPIVCAQVFDSCHSILKAVRGGRSMYRSAIVAREGEAETLAQLQGFDAAWVDRLSTAGYLLPMAHLREHGLEPEELLGTQTMVGSYGRALRAVVEREADVSAVYVHDATHEAVAATVAELVGEEGRLRAVSFTDEVPSDGLVVVDRGPNSDIKSVMALLRSLSDGRTHTMLLTIFDADALTPAQTTDYDALRTVQGANDLK